MQPPRLPLDVVVRERSSFGRAQSGWRGEITALLKSGTNDEIGRTEGAQRDGRTAYLASVGRCGRSAARVAKQSMYRSEKLHYTTSTSNGCRHFKLTE